MSSNIKKEQEYIMGQIAKGNSRLANLLRQMPVHGHENLHTGYQQYLKGLHHTTVPLKPIGNMQPRKRSKHATASNANGGRRTRRNKKYHKKSRKSRK